MSLYKRVVHDKLYEVIAAEIEDLIVAGQLNPGDTLPPERELGERFGVSRTAVREAIKVLCEKGLLTVQPGRGTLVNHPSTSIVTDSLMLLLRLGKASIAQLTEVRLALEPEMAARAAERASEEQIAALADLVAAERASASSAAEAVPLDVAFHHAICDAAQNVVARAMLMSIQEMLHQSMVATYDAKGDNRDAVAAHGHLVRAIRERDPAAARSIMHDHLEWVARNQRALAEPAASGN
jgi:GntR family transcriptional regulator, transcriptional repressor for pyruvate dehydrogenase complex